MPRANPLPKSVVIREGIIREGFQPKEKFIPTAAKIFLADAVADAGFRYVDAADYSKADRAPQFRDRDEVFRGIKRNPDVEYTGVAHTLESAEACVKAYKEGYGPQMLEMCIATSAPRNEAYFGLTHDETWRTWDKALRLTSDAGMRFQACLITIWSCPFQGRMDPSLGVQFAKRCIEMGITSFSHSDPYGDVTPPQAFEYFSEIVERFAEGEHSFHNHDWRGFGIANYLAAMQAGIRHFDTCLGGTGGWFASIVDGVPVKGAVEPRERPGRTGLVCTEDFVLLCDAMGVETGVDIEKMLTAGHWVEKIVGRRLNSIGLPWGPVTKAPRPGRWPASHGKR